VPVERLDPQTVELIRALVDRRSPYAEIWRRARPLLERRGLPTPSYPSVRRIVREERATRRKWDGTISSGGVTIEIGTGRIRIE
jgi:hypothetical protein